MESQPLSLVFNLQSVAWAAAILLFAAMLWRSCPDARRIVRNTLYFLTASYIALKLSDPATLALGGASASIVHAIAMLCVGAAIIRLLGLFIFRILLASIGVSPPSILEQILVVVAYFIWAMVELHVAGVPLGEIITTSAIATAVLAFAMQDTLGNILGGLALQWDHSLKVGDWIRVGTVEGKIVDIKWRAISIETRGWETVVIPNGMMMQNQFMVLGERTNEATRWRRSVHFHVDYSAHPEMVISLAEKAIRDAGVFNVSEKPAPNCVLLDISGSTAEYSLRFWLLDPAMDAPAASSVSQHLYAALNRQGLRLAMPKQRLYLTEQDDSYLDRKHNTELARRRAAICGIDLFESLSGSELNALVEHIQYQPFAQGDAIFHQGDRDHRLYIIASGEVGIHVNCASEDDILALSMNTGEFFGEIGFMTGEPRQATARAATAVECYVLSKEDFSRFLSTRQDIVEEISRMLISRQGAIQRARQTVLQGAEPPHHYTLHEMAGKIRVFLELEKL